MASIWISVNLQHNLALKGHIPSYNWNDGRYRYKKKIKIGRDQKPAALFTFTEKTYHIYRCICNMNMISVYIFIGFACKARKLEMCCIHSGVIMLIALKSTQVANDNFPSRNSLSQKLSLAYNFYYNFIMFHYLFWTLISTLLASVTWFATWFLSILKFLLEILSKLMNSIKAH